MCDVAPGIGLAASIAIAASGIATHHGALAMLFALLIGMAFHHLAADPRSALDLAFASKALLRIGVALLSLPMSFKEITSLG